MELDWIESVAIAAMGLVIVGVATYEMRGRQGLDRVAISLFLGAGAAAVVWMGPAVFGATEDVLAGVEFAETIFFFLLAGGVFAWSSAMLARHASMLEEARASLHESAMQKQMLLDILSHDVRNPLTAAKLRLDLLAMTTPGAKERAKDVEASLAKAQGIIEESLLLSKLDGAPLERARTDVSDMARRAVDSLAPLAAPKRVACRVEGEASADVHPLLQHAIENLLSNAIKWSPEGAEVLVALDADESSARIRVVDHGPGIPSASRKKLFRRFARLGTDEVKGVGLGLAIVDRVAQLHDGYVAIQETPGGGSTFVIELPRSARNVGSGAPANAWGA